MSDAVISLDGVGKMYRVYGSRRAAMLDAIGLTRILPSRTAFEEFWALRGIDFELGRGQRLGMIGRNGAGKTTMLKLIAGNVVPTEGTVDVRGTVQALIKASAGLHPEFTGWENIRAALTYQGLTLRQIREAEADIADFTELGEFLDQPFRTYSMGMQARLGFAVATAVRPEILIVDEVLGAGDAYFLTKSLERMRRLIEGGASVLMVSHSLDHIVRFCSEAVWLERGQIVERGPALEVVKSYDKFIRVLEERRLKAKNENVRAKRLERAAAGSLIVRVRAAGPPGKEACEVHAIRLLHGDAVEDEVVVGAPQDSHPSHSAAVLMGDGESWSPPRGDREFPFRTLRTGDDGLATASARFDLDGITLGHDHTLELCYRSPQSTELEMDVVRGEDVLVTEKLAPSVDAWGELRIPVLAEGAEPAERQNGAGGGAVARAQKPASRWPGEQSLMIDSVELLDGEGEERAVFDVGTPMTLRMIFSARESGRYDVIPVAVLFRLDGVLVSRFIGERVRLDLEAGAAADAAMHIDALNLGDDDYVFSVAIYRKFDIHDIEPSEWYDLLDRSFEFRVVGTPPLERGVFRHPGAWSVT